MATYTVQTGDTLFLIAKRFSTSVEKLIQMNNIAVPNALFVGQTLQIPEQIVAEAESVEFNAVAGNRVTKRVRGIQYMLFTNKSTYERREDVVITLVKTNVSGRSITLNYRNAQRYDFVARSRSGRDEIWRWSRGRSFGHNRASVTLAPGRSQTYQVTWDQRNNRGQQVSAGEIMIDGYNVANSFEDESVTVNIRIRSNGSLPDPTPSPNPNPGHGGNLIANPSFDNWPRATSTPPSWVGSNLRRSTISYSGSYAAEMGASSSRRALLTQKVSIEPGRIYNLSWWARENIQPGGVGRFILFVEIIYTDRNGNFVGRTEPRYSQDNIPNNRYQGYNMSTGRVPSGARIAEVRFTFEPSGSNTNTVNIDDVALRFLS